MQSVDELRDCHSRFDRGYFNECTFDEISQSFSAVVCESDSFPRVRRSNGQSSIEDVSSKTSQCGELRTWRAIGNADWKFRTRIPFSLEWVFVDFCSIWREAKQVKRWGKVAIERWCVSKDEDRCDNKYRITNRIELSLSFDYWDIRGHAVAECHWKTQQWHLKSSRIDHNVVTSDSWVFNLLDPQSAEMHSDFASV
jgi:hypothetical protein